MEKQLATQQREVAALKQSMMDGANGVEKQWKGTGKGARKGTGKASGGAKAKGNGKGGAGKGWGKSDGGKGAESGEVRSHFGSSDFGSSHFGSRHYGAQICRRSSRLLFAVALTHASNYAEPLCRTS